MEQQAVYGTTSGIWYRESDHPTSPQAIAIVHGSRFSN